MDDSISLTGMAQLVNKRKVNSKLDLEAIERDLIVAGSLAPLPIKDHNDEYAEIMQHMQDNQLPQSHYILNSVSYSSSIESDDSSESESISDEPIYKKPKYYTDGHRSSSISHHTNVLNQYQQPAPRYSENNMNHAHDALNEYAGSNYEYLKEQEQIEEQKERMLADIEELQDELQADDIDTSRIPNVNMDSDYVEVNYVYKILKRKYDKSRCEELGSGLYTTGAKALEMLFDGNKSYFGYRPDLTGWHRTVKSKMRRMRYENSVIVSDFLEKNNIGPVKRVMLELVPSAFLYSLTRREQHGTYNYTPPDKLGALDDLRDYD